MIANVATSVALRVLPRIPSRIKRLLLGRRSVILDGYALDSTLQLVLAAQNAVGNDGLVSSDDVVAERSRLETLTASFSQHIPVAGVTNLSIPGPAGLIPARHYRPDPDVAGGPSAILVFYHGGGFTLGSLESHDDQCRLICRDGGIHVLSIDYRLAPEHKFPAPVLDAFAAYRWAVDNAPELGIDPKRVAVGGDSAGGTLAAVVSQLARDEDVQLPALQLLLYPATDYVNTTYSRTVFADGFLLTERDLDWFRRNYLDGADVELSDPRVSPLLADDLSGLPPALVVTGGFDPLRDEGTKYAEAMRAAGVIVDHRQFTSLVHGFVTFFPLGGDSAAATTKIISALRAHTCHAGGNAW
ncbi:alpha/beta hydrolase [Mycobacterium sp. 852002-10029_SCH5224772]|uniref:alpha/beta hydrolase n=1 Tax=Mycobacterium sp. 852002-10029_SCH5224772 TaxID=1834083 RepID=UPI001E47D964|nr:alpha/beta hydrolase [Mycobacterium sp. 852002-10029_SCH5224772]